MTNIKSIVIGLAVLLALSSLLVAIKKRPDLEQEVDERIASFATTICVFVGGLALLYGVIRFVRWAMG